MTTVNKKNSFVKAYYPAFCLFFFLFLGSCNNKEESSMQPNNSARIGAGTNKEPIDGCSDGYVWNNAKGVCEIEAPILDINPALIVYNPSQAALVDVTNEPGTKYYFTPGTLNGALMGKSQLYINGVATNEIILIRIKNLTTAENLTEFFSRNGKFLGILKTKATAHGQKAISFTPTTGNPLSPTERNCWSSCVLHYADQISSNAVLLLACWYWSPQCAGGVAISCAAWCATH